MPQAGRGRASASPAPGEPAVEDYPLRSKAAATTTSSGQRTPELDASVPTPQDLPPLPRARQPSPAPAARMTRQQRSSTPAVGATTEAAATAAITAAPARRLTKSALKARLETPKQHAADESPDDSPGTPLESDDFQPVDPERLNRRRSAAAAATSAAATTAAAAKGPRYAGASAKNKQADATDNDTDDEAHEPQDDDVIEISSDTSDGTVSDEGPGDVILVDSDVVIVDSDTDVAGQQDTGPSASERGAAGASARGGRRGGGRGGGGRGGGRAGAAGRGSAAAAAADSAIDAKAGTKAKAAAKKKKAAAEGDAADKAAKRGRGGRGGRGRGRGAAGGDGAAAGAGGAAAGGAVGGGGRGRGARVGNNEDDGDVWGPFGADELEAVDLDAVYGAHESREPPSELLMPLLPFQKQFLAWAVKQEQGTIKGGILADEMGMGKTIQAISLIVTHRTDDFAAFDTDAAAAAANAKAGPAVAKDTTGPKLRIALKPPSGAAAATAAAAVAAVAGVAAAAAGAGALEGAAAAAVAGAGAAAVAAAVKATGAGSRNKRRKKEDVPPASAALVGPKSVVELVDMEEDGQQAGEQQEEVAGEEPVAAGKEAGCSGHGAGHQHGVGCDHGAHEDVKAHVQEEGAFCKATLVICPVVAIIQWRQEIARFTTPGALKVVVYHGAKRVADPEELASADVVLTTYSTIENEYRRTMMQPKVACQYCNKKFYPERLKVHLRFFCGPNAMKSEALSKQQKKKPKGGSSQKQAVAEGEEAEEEELELEEGGMESDEEGAGPSTKRRKANSGRAVAASKLSKGKAAAGAKAAKGKGAAAAKKAADKGKGKWVDPGAADSGSEYDPSSEEEEEEEEEEQEDEAESEAEEAGPSKGKKGKTGPAKGSADASGSKKRKWGKPINFWAALKGSDEQDAAEKDAQRMVEAAAKQGKGGRGSKAEEGSVLHQVAWRRIILDEAHCIKDRRCNTARAVFALNSKYKWALSGTPLQNRVAELYSLIRFLRIHPYSKYFCRQCGCSSLDHPFKKSYRQCDLCTHSALKHYCWWNRYVANPIKRYGYTGKGRHAMLVLRNEILPRILLRRTKEQCADDLALPPRTLVLRKDKFDEREEDFYEALYTQSQAQFGAYVETGTLLHNYAHIFDLLIRLRQAVDHPYLVVHSATGTPTAVPELQQEQQGQQAGDDDDGAGPSTPAPKAKGKGAKSGKGKAGVATCADDGCCVLCHDPREDELMAGCGHGFCRTCVTEYVSSVAKAKCPKCSKPLTIDFTAPSPGATTPDAPSAPSAPPSAAANCTSGRRKGGILSRITRGTFQSSTKIEALREELGRMMERDAGAKAIVFSQFTSMLDLIGFRLEQVGIKCVRLEGSMTLDARDRAIEAFTHQPDVRVFLMSLKAGGVALNLTAASHVMLMDPWWNPAVEQQYKPIHVTRFVIGGTIEERILKLQEKKQAVFEGTVGGDAAALGRLTADDMAFLFG